MRWMPALDKCYVVVVAASVKIAQQFPNSMAPTLLQNTLKCTPFFKRFFCPTATFITKPVFPLGNVMCTSAFLGLTVNVFEEGNVHFINNPCRCGNIKSFGVCTQGALKGVIFTVHSHVYRALVSSSLSLLLSTTCASNFT